MKLSKMLNWKRQQWLKVVSAFIGVLVGIALVLDKQSSELAIWGLFVLLLFPVSIVVLCLLLAEKWKILLDFLITLALFGFLAFQCFDWFYWPENIRYGFGSPPGASGSYHVVWFDHRVDGRWVEGPTVEGWPLRVAFPDLNSDGHKDIRVVEENQPEGGAIEYVYHPQAKDGIYWMLHRANSRLSSTYGAAGISINNP